MSSGVRHILPYAAVLLLMVVVIPCAILLLFAWRPVELPHPVRVEVKAGASFAAIAQTLADNGVVADAQALRVLARLTGNERGVHAGNYRFKASNTPLEVLDILTSGRVELIRCTIPEGLRAREIVAHCVAAGLGSSEVYQELLVDQDFISELGLDVTSLEGYLFPETYYFACGSRERTVLRTMVTQMQEELRPELVQAAAGRGLNRHELVTLASMVQKEAGNIEEMPRIAAVFLNRLQRNMRLQSDPTVIYALQDFDGNLTRAHLRTEHPYNTYVVHGPASGADCKSGAGGATCGRIPCP